MTQAGAENSRKVFGIGFSRTGTTTLGTALEHLGYKVCHGAAPVRAALGHRRMMDLLRANDLDPILGVAQWFEAFEDNPWFVLYRELDARFPGSRFILTSRDERSWLVSVRRFYGDRQSDLRQWLYGVGSAAANDDVFLERYRAHNRAVMQYFTYRPDDLLVVDWEKGDGWDALSAFLRRDVPRVPFPHENKSTQAASGKFSG